ncbi:MAG: hypothetical protein AB1403_05490 [Candidatus Riflebacteria bacterium]
MKRFYLLFFLILTVLTATGCKVFDWSSKDSSPTSSSNYVPPSRVETLEEERPLVNSRLNTFSNALISQDVKKSISICSPSRKDEYEKLFNENPNLMKYLGEAMKNATLDTVGPGYDSYGRRIGGVKVKYNGKTFNLNIVKLNGEWFLQDF